MIAQETIFVGWVHVSSQQVTVVCRLGRFACELRDKEAQLALLPMRTGKSCHTPPRGVKHHNVFKLSTCLVASFSSASSTSPLGLNSLTSSAYSAINFTI